MPLKAAPDRLFGLLDDQARIRFDNSETFKVLL